MHSTQWAPRMLSPDDATTQDRALILLHIARKWDTLLLGFEKDPTGLGHDLALGVMVQLIRPWVHPLLTDLSALDLMVGLNAAVSAQEEYLLFGTWQDEDNDALAGRSVEERHDLLQRDVNLALQRITTALEPVQ